MYKNIFEKTIYTSLSEEIETYLTHIKNAIKIEKHYSVKHNDIRVMVHEGYSEIEVTFFTPEPFLDVSFLNKIV